MKYTRYLPYTVVGGILWIAITVMIGYALTPYLDPLMKRLLGDQFEIRNHLEKVIIIVVFLSMAIPAVIVWVKNRKDDPAPIPEVSKV